MNELVTKYNRPTPRYTSYPPANFFSTDYTAEQYLQAVETSNHEGIRNLSFYIHIPFCPKMCHYCACNAYPMEARPQVERYMQALLSEIDIVCQHLDPSRPITQIHYGGGTPTAIPLHWLAKINDRLISRFGLAPGAEVAIECHPGYLSLGGWQELVKAGFNRMSLGVQDFHPEVLQAVNRQASREAFEDIFTLLRQAGIQINLDLIYGLPRQSVESFAENIKKAIALQPDRLVTFSYAHVPWVKEGQRILEQIGLPDSETKSAIFAKTKTLLTEAGYEAVGLDHFVRPHDPLAIAQRERMLHRNFQGYCSRATTGQVYAFGVTAISQLSASYAQNTKDIPNYITAIEAGHLPIERGYNLSKSEQLAGEIITSLMCNGQIHWADLVQHHSQANQPITEEIYRNEELLNSLSEDGLITLSTQGVNITTKGQAFARVIASAFDPLMQNSTQPRPYSLAL